MDIQQLSVILLYYIKKVKLNFQLFIIKLKQTMGNICAGKHQKQQTQTVDNFNRNFVLYSYLLNEYANIDLIIGTYHCHRSDTLLAIVQKQFLDYCPQVRDYARDVNSITSQILSQQAKNLIYVPVNKECKYKRLQVCVLPIYKAQQEARTKYLIQFQNNCRQIIEGTNDLTIQLTHTSESSNGIPNQMLMTVFMKVLHQKTSDRKSANIAKPGSAKKLKLSVIASDAKLINLVRFQIIKLEEYQVRKSKRFSFDNNFQHQDD